MTVSESIRAGCAMSLPTTGAYWRDKDGNDARRDNVHGACVVGAWLLGCPDRNSEANQKVWWEANDAFYAKYKVSPMMVNEHPHCIPAALFVRRHPDDIRLDIADAFQDLGY